MVMCFWVACEGLACVGVLFGLGNCGAAGCGGTNGCGGVCWDGVLVTLAGAMGVCCPQGSELPGDVSVLCCPSVWCVSAATCGAAGAIN